MMQSPSLPSQPLMNTILNLQVRLVVKPLKDGVLKVVGVN
jgi:hypothetical protein